MRYSVEKLNLISLLKIIFFNFCFVTSSAQTGASFPKNQLVLPNETHKINFIWRGDTVNGKWEPHSALLVPVKLSRCPKQFYMQFDLGSPYSMFYVNKIKTIQAKYPESIRLNDSASKLTDISFEVGNKKVLAGEIFVKQFGSSVINWQSKNSIEIIGTIGVDFIENRVTILDYPGRKLLISNTIPPALSSRLTLTDFMFVRNSILLPAIIKGKKTMLYFDTGSSAYELLTNKETCAALSEDNSAPVQYKVKSWDRFLTANTVTTKDSIEIASAKIPINKATYIEGASNTQVEQMMKLGMGGMTGNKLFLNSILVLDTKNKKFGIANSK